MPKPRDARTEIRKLVFTAMGLGPSKGILREKSRSDIHAFLQPYGGARYPLVRAGDRTKIAQEYLQAQHRLLEFYQRAMREVGLIGERETPFTIYPLRNSLLYQIKARKR